MISLQLNNSCSEKPYMAMLAECPRLIGEMGLLACNSWRKLMMQHELCQMQDWSEWRLRICVLMLKAAELVFSCKEGADAWTDNVMWLLSQY